MVAMDGKRNDDARRSRLCPSTRMQPESFKSARLSHEPRRGPVPFIAGNGTQDRDAHNYSRRTRTQKCSGSQVRDNAQYVVTTNRVGVPCAKF